MHISEVSFGVSKKRGSERNDVVRQLYQLYDSGQEDTLRKKDNWKRYVAWLKENKIRDSKELQEKFKRNKKFLKKISEKNFAFFLSHIPTKDLYYVLSICKDLAIRNKSIGKYIIGLSIPQKY